MTNDRFNLLFGALAVIAFMGTFFALAKAASLGRRRNDQGKAGSSETIKRLYLASKFLPIAAVICGMAVEISRTERASLAGFASFALCRLASQSSRRCRRYDCAGFWRFRAGQRQSARPVDRPPAFEQPESFRPSSLSN